MGWSRRCAARWFWLDLWKHVPMGRNLYPFSSLDRKGELPNVGLLLNWKGSPPPHPTENRKWVLVVMMSHSVGRQAEAAAAATVWRAAEDVVETARYWRRRRIN